MNLNPPFMLFLQGELFGMIITYGYDTPWAVGRLEAVDVNHLRSMIEVCEFSAEVESWPHLVSVEEDDERWRAALDRRGITQFDLEQYSDGPWLIEMQDGTQQEIFLPLFDHKGFVTWRW